jgi:hypothetical protein
MTDYKDILGEMLTDRGLQYTILAVPESTEVAGLTCIVAPRLVYYFEGRTGVNDIKAILDTIGNGAILVTDDAPSPMAKRLMAECDITVNHFTIAELSYNVVRHPIQPRFELVRNATGFDEYAGMSATDPVARYYDARPGDVFVITRRTGARAFRRIH